MERKRSRFWTFFSKESENKAKCDLCHSLYSIKGGSTTNLKKHLLIKHRASYDSLFLSSSVEPSSETKTDVPSTCQQSNFDQESETKGHCSGSTSSDQSKVIQVTRPKQIAITTFVRKPMNIAREKKINDLVLKLIVKDLQPFSVVEDAGFNALINFLEPNYKIPSRSVLSTNLLDGQFMLVKEKLKDELKRAQFVSLTTDGWTSRATTSYQAVTAHYILEDVWELRSALLGCFECLERHTAEYIKQKLIDITTEWEINNKICACVTDNAANMKAAIRLTGWEHLPCIAHTFNLIVRAGLQLDAVQNIIKKVKSIVEHFHKSPVATNKLIDMQEQLKTEQKPVKLKMDVITRWNSTLDMLERVVRLQEPLEATIGLLHNPVENLSEDEWLVLPEIVKLLKPFKQLTEEMSSQNEVTISKILPANNSVLAALNKLRNTVNRDISKSLFDKLISEFNTRFKNSSRHPLLSKAALLDPRFKRQAFLDDYSYEHAKNSLKTQLDKMSSLTVTSINTQTESDVPMPEEDSIWMEFDMSTNSNNLVSTVATGIITMRQYVEEKLQPRTENPLKWWRTRSVVYPDLSRLANKYLSIPASSVPSERTFSKSGLILSDRRAALKPKRMEKILFLNMNQRFLE